MIRRPTVFVLPNLRMPLLIAQVETVPAASEHLPIQHYTILCKNSHTIHVCLPLDPIYRSPTIRANEFGNISSETPQRPPTMLLY